MMNVGACVEVQQRQHLRLIGESYVPAGRKMESQADGAAPTAPCCRYEAPNGSPTQLLSGLLSAPERPAAAMNTQGLGNAAPP